MRTSLCVVGVLLGIAVRGESARQTVVIAPGNGVASNVVEAIDGDVDVQINDGAQNGGLVTLSALSEYRGSTYVKSGTLSVGSVGSVLQPSPIGACADPANAVIVGNGTFHFTGAYGRTDRDFIFQPDAARVNLLGVVKVDADGELRVEGRVTGVNNGAAAFVKLGEGTFTIATRNQKPGTRNVFTADRGSHNNPVVIPANGDSPAQGVSCFNVLEGRVVVDTAAGVTNSFGNETLIGAIAPTPHGAHLDIRGGHTEFPGWLAIARSPGDASTDPAEGFCSLNVSGGTVRIGQLGLAYQQNNSLDYNSLAVLNVSGGDVENHNYMRVDHTRSRGVVNVSGGALHLRDSYVAHYNAGSEFTLNLTGGLFESKGQFSTSEKGDSTVRFNLMGGTFAAGRIWNSGTTDTRITASGAALKMRGDWTATKMVCGPGPVPLTLDGGSRTLTAPLEANGADARLDVAASRAGYTLTLTDRVGVPVDMAESTVLALGGNAVTAPVTLAEGAGLRLSAATTLPDLRMGKMARLTFADASAKLTLGAWQAPEFLRVTLADAETVGTRDLVTFPASVDFAAERVQVVGGAAGRSYAFAVRAEGDRRTLAVTVTAGSAGGAEPVGYTTRLYPFASFPSATVQGPITVEGVRDQQMGVDVPEGETLTFAGGLTQENGGFIKLGAGTLRLAGPHDYVFAKDFGLKGALHDPSASLIPFDEAGNSLTAPASFEVSSGTLLLGEAGQKFAVEVSECWVGIGTQTNGVQGDAQIIQTGGDTYISTSHLCVGRNPGYWKSETENTLGGRPHMNATYTLNGGRVNVFSLIVGYDNLDGAPQHAKFEMFGGAFRQTVAGDRLFRIGGSGRHPGVSEAAFVMHGGTAEIATRFYFPDSNSNMRTLLSLSDGAEMTFLDSVECVYKQQPAVIAITNSTLRFTTRLRGTSNHTLIVDGATLVPGPNDGGDDELSGFGTFVYGAGGLTVDTSRMNHGWFSIIHSLVGSGTLTVRGADVDRCVCLRDVAGGHACPVVVEAGGALAVTGERAAACTVTVHSGGLLGNTGTGGRPSTLAALVLGDDADSVTYLRGTHFGAANMWGFSVGALTVNGTVRVSLRQSGTDELSTTFAGRVQVLTAPRGALDPARFELDPRVRAAGIAGTFSLVQNEDGTDTLWLDAVGAAGHTHVWSAAGGGTWAEAANWSGGAPEDLPGDPVTFPASLKQAAQVDLGGATRVVGGVSSASPADVTLANGALRLDNGTSVQTRLASTGGGTLTVPGVETVADPNQMGLVVQGRVALEGPITGPRKLTAADGAILSVNPRYATGLPIELGKAWLRPSADGVLDGAVTAKGNGLFVMVPEGVVAGLARIDNQKPFVKIGAGTLVLTGTGSFHLGRGGLGDINAENFTFPTDGSTPSKGSPAVGIYGGRVILGREGQEVIVNNNEFWVGGHPVLDADGTTPDVQLDVCGGKLTVPNFFGVGRTRNDVPTNNGLLKRRPNYTFNLFAGEVTARDFLMNYCTDLKLCVNSVVNIHGGSFTVTGGRFAIGHHTSSVTIDGKRNEAVFNQYGGTVRSLAQDVWVVGYSTGGRGELNLYGGVFDASGKQVGTRLGNAEADASVIRLAGGTLKTKRLYKESGYGRATLVLNGGVFQPTADEALSGFNSCYASTNATAIDVSLVESHTLDQVIAHDPELGETPDGGIVKRGGGRLLVKRQATFTGPLDVAAGVVDLDGAARYELAGLKGAGAVTNGGVFVSGIVEPKADSESAGSDGVTLAVDALTFGTGAKWQVDVIDAEAGVANRLVVKKTLVAQGPVTVDFGHSAENPLPGDFSALIGFVDAATALPTFACVNTGLSNGRRMVISRVNGRDVYARALPTGTVILFR